MTTEDVLESLVNECHDDHVGLWEIVNAVRFDLGSDKPVETRTTTLRLVRCLLQERGMQVGHPAPDGRHFVSWNVSTDQAVARIEKEWSALGREPSIGEVVWFTSEEVVPDKSVLRTGRADRVLLDPKTEFMNEYEADL